MHDRRQLPVMAAGPMETATRNLLVGPKGRWFSDMHKHGHSNPAMPILQSNDGRQIQTIGD